MKRAFRWVGFSALGLVLIVVVAACVLLLLGSRRLTRIYPEPGTALTVTGSSAQIARGKHLVRHVSQCVGCHGNDLGGTRMIDEPGFATIYAPNLTMGEGGAARTLGPADWDRAVRRGIAHEGRALAPMMPSEAAQNLSDGDLEAIVAYLESVPPVDNVTPKPRYGLLAKVLVGGGVFPLAPELVAATPRLTTLPAEGETATYGGYLAHIAGCTVCHGSALTGTEDPAEPGVMTPSLIAGAATWSPAEFTRTLRTGQTPNGRALDPEAMPWPGYAGMTDSELRAIHLYLESLLD